MDTGWNKLADAIILQAVSDYRKALRILRRMPNRQLAAQYVIETEEFFLSDWFSQLTEIDPQRLIQRLREEAA